MRGVAPTATSALHTISMESVGSTHVTTGAMLFTSEISLHSGRSMFMEGLREPFRGPLSRLDASPSVSRMSSNDRLLSRSWYVPAPLTLRNIMGERELKVEYAIVTLFTANQRFSRGFLLPFMTFQAKLLPLEIARNAYVACPQLTFQLKNITSVVKSHSLEFAMSQQLDVAAKAASYNVALQVWESMSSRTDRPKLT